jgi:hypothetical protein
MPSLRIKQACQTPMLPSQGSESNGQERSAQTSKILPQDLWPSIRLHGIKLRGIRVFNIKPYGIMPHAARLPSISGLNRDLFLPIKVASPRLTNLSTLKSRRRRKMKYCQQPPKGRQAWVRKKEDIHPLRGNGLT